jgi:hypothetical protein
MEIKAGEVQGGICTLVLRRELQHIYVTAKVSLALMPPSTKRDLTGHCEISMGHGGSHL